MQSNDPTTDLTTASQIRQDSSEIHPDSLTNDHGIYSLSSFVQGHEISSNSRGAAASEPAKEDSFKHLRSRGPPKKRRPELESDSDNEAEAGPTGRKERRVDSGKDVSVKTNVPLPLLTLRDFQDSSKWREFSKSKKMPPYFDLIEENMYLTERKKSKSHRDIKRMQCECPMLSREERSKGVMACGEDCLNRLLMIECSSRCLNGAYCSNRRFQKKQHADFEVILTEDKGWGLRAAKDMPANTFVLEYCGEVLDHKEFKARVKDYARMKNIHYYFMSLKNNEIIDATLKGNCSRFMNHSCEPNCETQKWTVNGQLRVGFFTTKGVTAGTELTFDYQFQRYGKEAQKCYCGAPSCRGFLGGENRVSVRAAGGKMKKDRTRKSVDEELEALLDNGEGLYDEKQVVALCRLMVRVETMEQKLLCLKLIQDTQNPSCLKQFLDHHGLSLLWIFMVELSEAKGNSTNNIKLQLEILKTLDVLPISTKNMLEESKVLTLIQRWAQTFPQPTENDGYSSENTTRAGTDMDNDTSKPSVFRRLKIISENSLDSALSDASKASDGKEDDEDDDEDDDESSRAGLSEVPEAKPEPEVGTKAEPDAETKVEPGPSVVGTPSQDDEDGLSDVESERSQEPPLSSIDISGMAARLLESWKDLKEVYRIPKKNTQKEMEKEGTMVNGHNFL
uniref:[histone H3]-lysine(36) N-trimethyltransferase n=1 Tax=Neogobius melanostomus TaxID=47308 RepID=A0A8C6SV63_9GOBI